MCCNTTIADHSDFNMHISHVVYTKACTLHSQKKKKKKNHDMLKEVGWILYTCTTRENNKSCKMELFTVF